MRRLIVTSLLLSALTPAVASAGERSELRSSLSKAMSSAGGGSSAYVREASQGGSLYKKRAGEMRSMASNTKLFTTAAVLGRFDGGERLATEVLGAGTMTGEGVFQGDLYLRGGGDPTFGDGAFARGWGSDARVGSLARSLKSEGIRRVRGRVMGDESGFDSLRGGPASNYDTSPYVGPLSALSYNRGRTGGSGFQSNPPDFAATQLDRSLEKVGVSVRDAPRVRAAPPGAARLAVVRSPTIGRLVALTNKPSDNLMAELFAKQLGARAGAEGSTAEGARLARGHAQEAGARPAIVDGSGLSRSNRASPRDVVSLLDSERYADQFGTFFDSLAVAGTDGTLHDRMRDDPAEGRCHAKTGTLTGVSALSGYCESRGGETMVFSFLMNGIDTSRARRLQDRMTNAVARYRG